jgi:hypothetical protein
VVGGLSGSRRRVGEGGEEEKETCLPERDVEPPEEKTVHAVEEVEELYEGARDAGSARTLPPCCVYGV